MRATRESKWKQYHSTSDFDRGPKKIWAEGWIVEGLVAVEKRTIPGKARPSAGGGIVEVFLLPIVWLFNQTQPNEILLVRYDREMR